MTTLKDMTATGQMETVAKTLYDLARGKGGNEWLDACASTRDFWRDKAKQCIKASGLSVTVPDPAELERLDRAGCALYVQGGGTKWRWAGLATDQKQFYIKRAEKILKAADDVPEESPPKPAWPTDETMLAIDNILSVSFDSSDQGREVNEISRQELRKALVEHDPVIKAVVAYIKRGSSYLSLKKAVGEAGLLD